MEAIGEDTTKGAQMNSHVVHTIVLITTIAVAGTVGYFLGTSGKTVSGESEKLSPWKSEISTGHAEGEDHVFSTLCRYSDRRELRVCISISGSTKYPDQHRGPALIFVLEEYEGEISHSRWPSVWIDDFPIPSPKDYDTPSDSYHPMPLRANELWLWDREAKWKDRMADPVLSRLLTGERLRARVFLQDGDELEVDFPLREMQIILNAMIPCEMKG